MKLFQFLQMTGVWVGGLALAAFLVLFWALRGAPIGQAVEGEGEDAPRGGYRDRVIAAMVLGLMLVAAGAYVAATRGVPWSLPVFALGFGIVVALIVVNRRHRHASPALRRTLDLSNALLNASLLAGVLIVINAMAFRYGARAFDLTREHTFSLASLSVNQAKHLEKPVKFTAFYGQSRLAAAELERVRELLELYKAVNPSKITIEAVNPYTNPERFALLVEQVPDVQVSETGGVVIEYGEGKDVERRVVPNSELFRFPRQGRFPENVEKFISTFRGEEAVTMALMRLRKGERPKIAFLTGHGEPPLANLDPRKEGLGQWRSRLESMGAEVVEVNLLHDDIPRDVELVIAVAGRTPFHDDEAAKLRRSLAGGRPAMVLVGYPGPTGLEELLKTYNVTVGSGMIIDFKYNLKSPQLVLVPGGTAPHPITDALTSMVFLFVNASPLKVAGGAGGKPNPEFIARPILMTSRDSWAETNMANRQAKFDAGQDERGPLTVAVAVSARGNPDQGQPQETPRLVVFASRGMADNVFLGLHPSNLDLLVNAGSWLRGRPAETGEIGENVHEELQLVADPILRTRLILVPTTMAMLLIVSLGLITYTARRE